jgi:DNA-binding transcriptional LysR family regulator
MNITQLRGLIAVSDAGSFTAAAESVGITQSGLSQALASLEDSLGVKLLVRQRHGVGLTAFGERTLAHAREACSRLDAIRAEAAEATGTEKGSLRIAAFPSVFATFLPPLLRRFRTLHPDIELVVLETDDREVEAWLAAGSIDIGVVLNPPKDSDAVPIGRDAWVAVLPSGHPLGRRKRLALSALVGEPFVLATGGCHVHAGTLADGAGLSFSNIRMEVRDWTSAIALVREGAGISLVPESTLPDQRRGLQTVSLDPPLFRRFGVRMSPARVLSQAAARFFDVAARQRST